MHLRLVRPELSVQLADGFLDGGNLFVPKMRHMQVEDGGDVDVGNAFE